MLSRSTKYRNKKRLFEEMKTEIINQRNDRPCNSEPVVSRSEKTFPFVLSNNDCPFPSSDELSDDSDSQYDDNDSKGDIRQSLIDWSIKFNVSNKALTELLQIISPVYNLPLDARTLLKTPRKANVTPLGNGMFAYFGLRKQDDTSQLRLHIDGLPLHKSSNLQFWTIMGAFEQTCPFVIATFCGNEKPPLSDFLKPLIDELLMTETNVHVIICDSPARSFVKCTKYPGSYSCCDRCTVRGEYVEGRVTYEDYDCSLRTNETFRAQSDQDHHTNESPLLQLPLDMVKVFSLDYQHLVCLGTMRRMLLYLMKGPLHVRIGNSSTREISDNLISLKSYFPSEINRKPRSLQEIRNWKATEFRSFILYSGPLVLRNLSENVFEHFKYLHAAIFILCHRWLCKQLKSVARRCLLEFVQRSSSIYGDTFCVYNIHCLIHLADDMERFDSLDECSAFPFENYMSTIKRKLRGCHLPLEQFSNRTLEAMACSQYANNGQHATATELDLHFRHSNGPTHQDMPNWKQFKACHYKSIRFAVSGGDAFFFDENFMCYRITNILSDESEGAVFLCHMYRRYKSLYSEPIDSKRLNIYIVSSPTVTLDSVSLSQVRYKACAFPFRKHMLVFPLLEVD